MVAIFNVDFFVLSAGNEDIAIDQQKYKIDILAFSQLGLKYL